MLSKKAISKISRIDIVVEEYFRKNPTVWEVEAKDLMGLFVERGIFLSDDKKGVAVRHLLVQLEEADQLCLLKKITVIRKRASRNWYFVRL
jgi:hypothetical protein